MSIPAQGAVDAETMTAAEQVCHEEQMVIWSSEMAERLAMGDWLREHLSYEDKLGFYADLSEGIRDIVGSAFALASPRADSDERTAGVLWSAWSEDDCDSDSRIDPMAQKVTEWFVGRWPVGAEEPECRILIGAGRSAEIIARRIAEKLTSVLNTDAIVARKPATPAQPAGAAPDSLRALSEAAIEAASAAYYDGMMGEWPHTLGWAGKPEKFKASVRTHMAKALAAAFATHPAGQSAGSGAGWTTPHRSPVSPQTEAAARRIAARRAGGAYADAHAVSEAAWRSEIHAAEAALFGLPAPDSTRTGDEGTDDPDVAYQRGKEDGYSEGVLDASARAGLTLEYGVSPDPEWHVPGPIEMLQRIAEHTDALAARPAAPEAQGTEECENCAGQKHTDMGTTPCPVCRGSGRQWPVDVKSEVATLRNQAQANLAFYQEHGSDLALLESSRAAAFEEVLSLFSRQAASSQGDA